MFNIFYFAEDTPLRPKITINFVTRTEGEMSITYGSCPEYPHDLGVLVNNWKVLVCEENSERNIMSEDELKVMFSSKLKSSYCKSKFFYYIYIDNWIYIHVLNLALNRTMKIFYI